MPDLVYKLGLGLYARNENSGLFEPVDRTNDARKALKVQTELAQPLTSAQLTSAELATAGKQDELKVVIGSTTDPDTADTGVGIWKNIRSTLANIASDTLQMVLTWLPILGAIRDRLPPVLDVDGGVKVHVQNPATGGASEATLATFKTEAKTESDETQVKIDELLTQVEAQAVADGGVPARSQSGSFLDGITVTSETPTTVIPAATGKLARTIILPNEETNPAAVFVQTGSAATRLTKKIQPGDTLRLSTNQAVSVLVDGPTSTGRQFFRDSSSFGHDGELVGTPKPTLVASPFAGFGNAAEFDGVDRGANSQGVDLGTSQDFALRGQTGRSYESAVRALNPASYWRMNETSGDILDQMPHQPYHEQVVKMGARHHWRMGEAGFPLADIGPGNIPITQGDVLPSFQQASLITPAQSLGDGCIDCQGGVPLIWNMGGFFEGSNRWTIVRWCSPRQSDGALSTNFSQEGVGGRLINFQVAKLVQQGQEVLLYLISRAVAPGNQGTLSVSEPFVPGAHMYALTYDGQTLSVYRNYELKGSVAAPLPTTPRTSDFLLGGNNGRIDEVSFFNRALTATEIHTLYTYGTSKIGACHGVVSGNVTRNAPSLIEQRQNNPFDDPNGSLRLQGGAVNFGNAAYRLVGRQPFWVRRIVQPAISSGSSALFSTISGASPGIALLVGAPSSGVRQIVTQRGGGIVVGPFTSYAVPDDGLTRVVDFIYDGSTQSLYINGQLIQTVPDNLALLTSTENLRLTGDSSVVDDDLSIFLFAPTAQQIADLYIAATVWDGKRPKTIDVKVRPDALKQAVVLAREDNTALDYALELTVAGAKQLRCQSDMGSKTLSGGSYTAGSQHTLRIKDDRTEVLVETPPGTVLSRSFARPAAATAPALKAIAGQSGKSDVAAVDGIIDELRVSNIVRTDGPGPYSNDANTLALIKFDVIDSEVSGPPVTQKIYPYVSETDK